MNDEAVALLKKILEKDPDGLTEADKDFLIARKSYVGKTSREKFSNVFKEKRSESKGDMEPERKSPEYIDLLNRVKELGYNVTEEATEDELTAILNNHL